MKIYHNPRCSTSRKALALLEEKKQKVEVVEYLKEVPKTKDLELLLQQLNLEVKDIIRKNEQMYKEKFKDKNFTDKEWLKILQEFPKLIQRPIVVKGNKAVIGRPIENILDLIK